uniref:Uncharacterized protein n=1 Tax=Oryza rufipogon TaxID=4529 RepID=A0A0E0Q5Q9_ORYRU
MAVTARCLAAALAVLHRSAPLDRILRVAAVGDSGGGVATVVAAVGRQQLATAVSAGSGRRQQLAMTAVVCLYAVKFMELWRLRVRGLNGLSNGDESGSSSEGYA